MLDLELDRGLFVVHAGVYLVGCFPVVGYDKDVVHVSLVEADLSEGVDHSFVFKSVHIEVGENGINVIPHRESCYLPQHTVAEVEENILEDDGE